MSRVKLIYQIMHNIVMFKKFQTCILQVKYIATIPEVPHSQKKVIIVNWRTPDIGWVKCDTYSVS